MKCIIALTAMLILVSGCKKKEAAVDDASCCNTIVGYRAGTLMQPGMNHDTIVGAFAEVAPGLSWTTEIGAGVCEVDHGICLNGVALDTKRTSQISSGDIVCLGMACTITDPRAVDNGVKK